MKVVYDLGNIADWLSAIGTVGAVVVALYLANREKKPKAKVSCTVDYAVDTFGGMSEEPVQVSVKIVNRGSVPIYLSECSIQVSKRNKARLLFPDGSNHLDKKMLNPGEPYEHTFNYQMVKAGFMNKGINNFVTYAYFKDAQDKSYKGKIRFNF